MYFPLITNFLVAQRKLINSLRNRHELRVSTVRLFSNLFAEIVNKQFSQLTWTLVTHIKKHVYRFRYILDTYTDSQFWRVSRFSVKVYIPKIYGKIKGQCLRILFKVMSQFTKKKKKKKKKKKNNVGLYSSRFFKYYIDTRDYCGLVDQYIIISDC